MLSIHEINLLEAQNEALKKQNRELQEEIRRKDEQLKAVSKELDEYIQNLSNSEFEKLLQDNYFKGLNVNQILELAKKSIRLTAENRELENKLEDITTELEDLRKRYDIVLKLAKKNADANEYCIQELIRENEELKMKLGGNNERI